MPADSAAIVRLVIEAELFPPDAEKFIGEMMATYFAAGKSNGHSCLVDESDGEVAGVAYYQPKPAADRVWDLTMIAVRPGMQGRGRGAALLKTVEQDLRGHGQRLLLVETSGSAQYTLTRKFYTRNNYDEEATVRDYWEAGDDLVLFRKDLIDP